MAFISKIPLIDPHIANNNCFIKSERKPHTPTSYFHFLLLYSQKQSEEERLKQRNKMRDELEE